MRFATAFLLATQCAIVSSQCTCPKGWFGAGCRYLCQCINNMCEDDGSCQRGSRCERGWFGPACQYEDIASRGILVISFTESSTVLTDADDTTCLNYPSVSAKELYLDDYYPVTWFRFRVGRPEHRDNITIKFSAGSPSIYREILPCDNEKRAYVDDYTVDIHCQVSQKIIMIHIWGEGSNSLCSVYMSGGRNIALKQEASQSTIYGQYSEEKLGASNAVDGSISLNVFYDACAATMYGDPDPWWSVKFDRSYSVNRYVLYDREKDWTVLTAGFTLSAYGTGISPVVSYTQQRREYKYKQEISYVSSSSINRVKMTPTPGSGTMQSCEIQIFGETVSDSGRYGLQCENSCNCVNGTACFVCTGGCPSGCRAGYTGEDCQRQTCGCELSR